jgi:hypothetical protein
VADEALMTRWAAGAAQVMLVKLVSDMHRCVRPAARSHGRRPAAAAVQQHDLRLALLRRIKSCTQVPSQPSLLFRRQP